MGEPNPKAKWSKYAISEDGTLERKAEHCPNCGPGVFLGAHADRKTCGRCGYSVKNE
ncbi:MAG: 30S ribosomal protein S27ae [Candidatus Poseidoniaceae archaeon]|jgi:small subunit ribosomal protein S27Ae